MSNLKSISPARYFWIITQRWKCRLFERFFRSNRTSALVDELLGGKLSRTLAALFWRTFSWPISVSLFLSPHTVFLSPFPNSPLAHPSLRWLNTVLRAVSGNSRDGEWNKHRGEKAMVNRRRFLKIYSLKFCDIWRNFYFYRVLDNENFKMEVEQTIFVTLLIITVQL